MKMILIMITEKYPKIRRLITKLHLDRFISQDSEKREAENYKSDPITLRSDRLESDDAKLDSINEVLDPNQIPLNLSQKMRQYKEYIEPVDDIRSESDEVYELNSEFSISKI